MNEISALATAIAISLLLSSATVLAIRAPLRALLEVACPLASTAQFWTRAAVTVTYLLPLWAVLVFALSAPSRVEQVAVSEIARRALASASFALVTIVVATGLRLSSLRPPSRFDYPPPPVR